MNIRILGIASALLLPLALGLLAVLVVVIVLLCNRKKKKTPPPMPAMPPAQDVQKELREMQVKDL